MKYTGSWSPKLLLKCLRYRAWFRRKAERSRAEADFADQRRNEIRNALSQIAQHVPLDMQKRRFASGAGASALMVALMAAGISVTAAPTEAQADTFFTAFPFAGTGSPTLRTMPARIKDIINVMEYGALGDGTCAALSTRYGSLAAAQVVYSFATSLTQSIDWAASKAAVNAASTQSSGQLGRIIYPRGIYKFSTGDFVTLPPELFHGGGASWTIEGESPGSTAIYGSLNGFLLDTNPSGNINYTTSGGFALRDIGLNNANATAFTSGGIRLGGALQVSVNNVDISGNMVGITNELVPGQRTSNNAMSITNVMSSGQQRTNSIGIVVSGDGAFLSNINLSAWQYAICINAEAVFLGGSHFESNRNGVMMGRGGSSNGASPVPTSPVICSDVVMSAVTFEGNESTIVGFQGFANCTFINVGGQVHDIANWQGAGLQAQYGFDFRNGIAGCVFINCNLSGQAANENFVVHQANPSSGASARNKFINCNMTNMTGAPSWDLPTSGIGRAAYEFQSCNVNPYLPTASLPWDTLTGATLSGTTLTFTSGGGLTGTRGLFPNSGALITGASVLANTKVSRSGTSVYGVTFDDGAGGVGNTMTIYGATVGVPLGIGAVLSFNALLAYGPSMQNMVINGTALTFDVASFTGTMVGTTVLTVASLTGAILQPGMRLYPNATFGTDCYLMSQIDATHWTINKTLTFAGVACQAEADLRAGYTLDLSTSFGYTAVAIATRVGIGSYSVNNSQTAQAPQSGGIWQYYLQNGITITAGSGNVWTFTKAGGGGLNVGVSGSSNGTVGSGGVFSVPFNNTYEVNQSYGAPVGPESMTIYCDFEGDEYNVSDSLTAFSMGALMSLTGGGTTRCHVRRNDTQTGYIIVG